MAPHADGATLIQISNSHSGSEVEEEEEESEEEVEKEEEQKVDDSSTNNAGIPEITLIPPTSPLETPGPDESFHIFEVSNSC